MSHLDCDGCGMTIPYKGNVCPYCQTSKVGQKLIQETFMGWAMLFVIAFGIVGAIVGAIEGSDGIEITFTAIGYGFVGIIPGSIVGGIKIWRYI